MLKAYYYKNGWPKICNVRINHYKLWELEEVSKKCRLGLRNIELNLELTEYNFLDNQTDYDLFFELCVYASIGEYDIPINQSIATIKKEIICRSMNILFNIWNKKWKNSDYQYDNSAELDYILEYQEYINDIDKHETVLINKTEELIKFLKEQKGKWKIENEEFKSDSEFITLKYQQLVNAIDEEKDQILLINVQNGYSYQE